VLKNIYQALMLMQEDLGISLTPLSDGHHLKASFSRTNWVSQYQKGQTNLDFTEARDDGMAVASV